MCKLGFEWVLVTGVNVEYVLGLVWVVVLVKGKFDILSDMLVELS